MASAVISFITWAVRHLRCSSRELMCVIFIQRVQPALTVIGSWSVSSRFCFGIANSSSSLHWLSQPAFSFHRSISSSTCREWQRQLPRRPARSNHSINTFRSISSSTCREWQRPLPRRPVRSNLILNLPIRSMSVVLSHLQHYTASGSNFRHIIILSCQPCRVLYLAVCLGAFTAWCDAQYNDAQSRQMDLASLTAQRCDV